MEEEVGRKDEGYEAKHHKERNSSGRENQRPNKQTKCDRHLTIHEFQTSVSVFYSLFPQHEMRAEMQISPS